MAEPYVILYLRVSTVIYGLHKITISLGTWLIADSQLPMTLVVVYVFVVLQLVAKFLECVLPCTYAVVLGQKNVSDDVLFCVLVCLGITVYGAFLFYRFLELGLTSQFENVDLQSIVAFISNLWCSSAPEGKALMVFFVVGV